MLIYRYLFRETFKTQLGVLFVLFLIFVSQKFVQILAMAMKGNLPGELILKVVVLNLPVLALLIVPISLFIGILFAHGRLHAESEMVVLEACGYSYYRILGATMLVALVSTVFAIYNSFWLAPAGVDGESKVFQEADADAGLATLREGRFEVLGSTGTVVYVERYTESKELETIFVAQSPRNTGERPSVVVSDNGKVKLDNEGGKWLELNDGLRYEGERQRNDFRVLEFENYQVKIQEREAEDRAKRISAIPTSALLKSDDFMHRVELQWRIAQVVALPVLTFLVVPLAVVKPRQGRYAKLFPAILLFLSYFMLLSASRSAVEDGILPFYPGIWTVHIVYLALGFWLNLGPSELFGRLRAWRESRA